MPTPLQEYVRQTLAEHDRGNEIRLAFQFASQTVTQVPGNSGWRRKSTRRGHFWENAVDKLIDLTADDKGVKVVPHHDTVSFIYDDAVLVRLKKANHALVTSNISTLTAELFHEHSADLFGYEGLQRVEAVYVPNRFETGIIWVGIVARNNAQHLWHFELAEPVTALPVVPIAAPEQPAVASLVKVKNQAKGRDEGKKDGRGE